jgi:RHS repeat-associated protein
MVTDNTGAVVARFDYDAWGNLLASSFDNVPGGMPYGFVGALGVRFDSATGLHYMRHRWYDPRLQRFISRDPIGLSGDFNPYRYCGNSPTTWKDPSGLKRKNAKEEMEELEKKRKEARTCHVRINYRYNNDYFVDFEIELELPPKASTARLKNVKTAPIGTDPYGWSKIYFPTGYPGINLEQDVNAEVEYLDSQGNVVGRGEWYPMTTHNRGGVQPVLYPYRGGTGGPNSGHGGIDFE